MARREQPFIGAAAEGDATFETLAELGVAADRRDAGECRCSIVLRLAGQDVLSMAGEQIKVKRSRLVFRWFKSAFGVTFLALFVVRQRATLDRAFVGGKQAGLATAVKDGCKFLYTKPFGLAPRPDACASARRAQLNGTSLE
jgi:hypothetical protein